jgi:hypothetical protein
MTQYSEDGGFTYDNDYHRKKPDWSYTDGPVEI